MTQSKPKMVRTQIYLKDSQYKALTSQASMTDVPMGELIRLAVDFFLSKKISKTNDTKQNSKSKEISSQ